MKSQFLQKSRFQTLLFHEIHLDQIAFISKFTFRKFSIFHILIFQNYTLLFQSPILNEFRKAGFSQD